MMGVHWLICFSTLCLYTGLVLVQTMYCLWVYALKVTFNLFSSTYYVYCSDTIREMFYLVYNIGFQVLQDLSAIMLSCWSATASERPTSNMIYQSLRKLESDCSDDSINSSHHENEHRTNRVETTGRQRQVRFTDMRDPSSSDNGDASHKNTLARQDSHTPIRETSLWVWTFSNVFLNVIE